jgi:predicted GH43/DUF377 family glycosyl hydrolase
MSPNAMDIRRAETILRPEQSRVLLRRFTPGSSERVGNIIGRIMSLPEERVGPLLDRISAEFSERHQGIRGLFQERFEQVREGHVAEGDLSEERRLLIGSYFLAEYSLESAALFNPSIVPHTDQTGLPPGALRFILSLRATGEGHVSSITFRTGIIHPDHRIEVLSPSGFLTEPRQIPNPAYEKGLFERKLHELGLTGDFTRRVLSGLGDSFSLEELRSRIDSELNGGRYWEEILNEDQHTARGIWMLARSNYEVQFQPEQRLSERILFPATPSQRNGIEDARFVCFQNDDGSGIYYATFTAFDGRVVMPELVETLDFLRFRFITLNGPAARNKGMALFPRKIAGRYAMLSRQDNESVYLMFSDNVHFWNECAVLLKPAFPWEWVQIGNCGSPIETDAGWLVLSHGVGPMRRYCIGAFLLDREDPSKVIGRLREPLLQPNQHEREGYVPNVVYTCGALVHRGELIIPFGLADHATGFATVPVDRVLAAMQPEDG